MCEATTRGNYRTHILAELDKIKFVTGNARNTGKSKCTGMNPVIKVNMKDSLRKYITVRGIGSLVPAAGEWCASGPSLVEIQLPQWQGFYVIPTELPAFAKNSKVQRSPTAQTATKAAYESGTPTQPAAALANLPDGAHTF